MGQPGTAEGTATKTLPEDRQQIVERLRAVIAELSEDGLTTDEIDVGGHLFDHGYVDSLSAVMLQARIDEAWGVQVPDTEFLEGPCTLEALAGYIESRR